MTQSITIVNTGNWDQENVKITEMNKVIELKPGEMVTLYPKYTDVCGVEDLELAVSFSTGDDNAPFTNATSGAQIVPKVKVEFEEV